MKKLGIYFGANSVSVVESEGKKVLNQVQVPLPAPGDVKEQRLNALIIDELRKHNIKTEEAVVTLASKDLIVRSFDIPLMPRDELPAAVSSEVMKYIPFKIEELVYDFRISVNKKEKKNYILFTGIKSEELDNRYLSVLSAAMLKPKEIEYAVFSLLKLVSDSGIREKKAFAFIDVDLEDESNITIIDEGFPQFSRTLKVSSEDLTGKATTGGSVEKLTSEIRISLDFYRRKFPNSEVKKAVFLARGELRYEIENISRDLGLTARFVNIPQELVREFHASLGLVKAYAACLDIKIPYEIDLLAGKEKIRQQKKREAEAPVRLGPEVIKINKRIIFLGIIIAVGTFLLVQFKNIIPIQKEIQGIISQRLSLSTVSVESSLQDLSAVQGKYKDKTNTLDKMVKERQYFTPKFDFIPKLIPDGVWLTDFNYSDSEKSLTMRGAVHLESYEEEIKAINEFVSRLKQNPVFTSTFNDIRVVSMQQADLNRIKVTRFDIQCKK